MFPCLIKGHKYLYIYYIIKNPRALAGLVSGSVVAHGAAGSLVACGAGSPVRGMLDCGWMGNGLAVEPQDPAITKRCGFPKVANI